MELKLNKKPKGPVIIEGFPGFGLVGNIVTEFLIEHLKAERIGSIQLEEIVPVVAIHEGRVVDPIGIYYDKKNNIIILNSVANPSGLEWQLSSRIKALAQQSKAKEIITIEGVNSPHAEEEAIEVFYHSISKDASKKFNSIGVKQLKEGVVIGTSGALLLERDKLMTLLFVETHSRLPDSKAAAKAVEVLDKYLDLKVDYKPLLEQAEKFEAKLKKLMEKSQQSIEERDKKKLSYIS